MADEHGPVEGDVYMGGESGPDYDEQVPVVIDGALIGGLTRAEIDIQIATAHRFRRVISNVKRQIETLATLDQETAEGAFYRLPRQEWDPKTRQMVAKIIEGPSIRFAEIALSAYGNARVASRRTDLTDTDVEATGIFHDLESNVAWAKSVRKSIMSSPKKGDPKRFSNDMINVTTNATASIALRNAILAGIPRGYWKPGYDKAMAAAKGTAATLGERRARMIQAFADNNVAQAQVFEILGVRGLDDITLDVMFNATGLLNAIKEGEVTIDELLAEMRASNTAPTLDDAFGKAGAGKRQAQEPKASTGKGDSDKPKPEPDNSGKASGEAAAQSAETPKDTKGSATAASTGSAEGKSGQQESSSKPDAGAAKAGADVVEFPGDRGRQTIDLGTAPKPDVAGPAEEPDKADGEVVIEGDVSHETPSDEPSAEVVEAFNTFARNVQAATTWSDITAQVQQLWGAPAFKAAPEDTQDSALLLAYSRAEALNEELFVDQKVRPENDPLFYRLWLRQAPKHEVMNAFRVVMRTKAYQGLSMEVQDAIMDETEKAAK